MPGTLPQGWEKVESRWQGLSSLVCRLATEEKVTPDSSVTFTCIFTGRAAQPLFPRNSPRAQLPRPMRQQRGER